MNTDDVNFNYISQRNTEGSTKWLSDVGTQPNCYFSLPNKELENTITGWNGLETATSLDRCIEGKKTFNTCRLINDNCMVKDGDFLMRDKYRACENLSKESFGLSESLSRESVRKACEVISDDLSDYDSNEVQNVSERLQNSFQSHGMMAHKEKANTEVPADDAFDAIQELDAILEIHDKSLTDYSSCSLSRTESDVEQTRVQDCLEDLDNYLEQMDECSVASNTLPHIESGTLPLIKKKLPSTKYSPDKFQRSENVRKTISCAADKQILNDSNRQIFDLSSSEFKRNNFVINEHSNERRLSVSSSSFNILSESEIQENSDYAPTEERTESKTLAPNSSSQNTLTAEKIFQNLLEQNSSSYTLDDETRPRQFGRRAEGTPRISLPSINVNRSCVIVNYQDSRPSSAPIASLANTHYSNATTEADHSEDNRGDQTLHIGSETSTIHSSHNTSAVSIETSSESSDCSTSLHRGGETTLEMHETDINHENVRDTQKRGFNAVWPYSCSRTIALLSCTLGLFNTCRFAVLTVSYGGNFLIQFLLLSIIFGIPFFWLQMCLGAKIKAGPVSMWRISPICCGIGLSLVLLQYLIAIYSSVVIVWLLIFIHDTFKYQSNYRWLDPIFPSIYENHTSSVNVNLTQHVPDYFNIIVLQRLRLLMKFNEGSVTQYRINDRLIFGLFVLWISVFSILCKGLKSFGKIIVELGPLAIIALVVVTGKMLSVIDLTKFQYIFSSGELDDFLINSKTWGVAAQETFLTWGLLGSSVIAITSRTYINANKTTLRRDAILVVLLTFLVLSLAALVGLSCIQLLNQKAYVYIPGSYETLQSSRAVYLLSDSTTAELISFPAKLVPHYSSFFGETYRRPTTLHKSESGYQMLRFVTELLPSAVGVANDKMSWVWTAVIFISLLTFGINQLCVMWHSIASALGSSTRAVLLSCMSGLLLSIPFATEAGVVLLHYMDFLLGGAWFIPILWVSHIFGVFLIRGRPYNGDDLVNDLKMSGSMSAFLALSWNVLLPIGLIALSVINYKISLSSQLYYWRGKSYFSYWSRKVGALTQIGFLLLVPIAAIVQIYRYLSSGPPDILDRIQLLYCPLEDSRGNLRASRMNGENIERSEIRNVGNNANTSLTNNQDDAPPKYTPPPSYTTATGARLAKILRQSIRRSVRRILGENRSRPILTMESEHSEPRSIPPDYTTILTDQSTALRDINPSISETIEIDNRPSWSYSQRANRSLSLGRKEISHKHRFNANAIRPMSGSRVHDMHTPIRERLSRPQRPYTAEDVVTILRSSTINRHRTSHSSHPQCEASFCSNENLVLNAEPPDLSNAIETNRRSDEVACNRSRSAN
uniref:Transporter n=1 Tax=Glossina brevipalpis TaxID=37001 RepID=A0A1A9WAE8_9MUSC